MNDQLQAQLNKIGGIHNGPTRGFDMTGGSGRACEVDLQYDYLSGVLRCNGEKSDLEARSSEWLPFHHDNKRQALWHCAAVEIRAGRGRYTMSNNMTPDELEAYLKTLRIIKIRAIEMIDDMPRYMNVTIHCSSSKFYIEGEMVVVKEIAPPETEYFKVKTASGRQFALRNSLFGNM